jgi:hypothetical protein
MKRQLIALVVMLAIGLLHRRDMQRKSTTNIK